MMKSFYLFAALVLGFAGQAFAQSSVVSFSNGPQVGIDADRRVYADFVGGTLLAGTNWVAQLYYGPDVSALIPVAAPPARFRPTTTPVPGIWVGGLRTLIGFAPGEPMIVEVRVWDQSL